MRFSKKTANVLLQSTIAYAEDDWHIGRFSLLADYLQTQGFRIACRNRTPDRHGDDEVLVSLAKSDFDEVWLFGADAGNGLSMRDAGGVNAFRQRGGGLLTARDHQDLGLCLRLIKQVGTVNYYHSRYGETDLARRTEDDRETPTISWPNYHSGANGDYQHIRAAGRMHPVLQRDNGATIEYFPAHPHEGAIGVEECGAEGRVVATGISQVSGRVFNLIAAMEPVDTKAGRALTHSSFHHFADYNWDPRSSKPSFVSERAGDGMLKEPQAAADIRQYARNAAHWLAGADP